MEPIFSPEPLRLLAETVGDLGPSFVREIVDEALTSVQVCRRALEEARAKRDHAAFRAAAHRVKSVFAQLGARRLEGVARGMELAAARGEDSAFGAMDDFEAALPATLDAVKAFANAS